MGKLMNNWQSYKFMKLEIYHQKSRKNRSHMFMATDQFTPHFKNHQTSDMT